MKVIYAPEGRPAHSWEFQLDSLTGPECEALEEAGGTQWDTYGRWLNLFVGPWLSYRASRALVWVLLRRDDPQLAFDSTSSFKLSELSISASDDEVESGKGESGTEVSGPDDEPTSAASPMPG